MVKVLFWCFPNLIPFYQVSLEACPKNKLLMFKTIDFATLFPVSIWCEKLSSEYTQVQFWRASPTLPPATTLPNFASSLGSSTGHHWLREFISWKRTCFYAFLQVLRFFSDLHVFFRSVDVFRKSIFLLRIGTEENIWHFPTQKNAIRKNEFRRKRHFPASNEMGG